MAFSLSSVSRRLKEPSTWAGFSVLGAIFGIKELAALGAPEIIGGLTALLAILLPEKDRSAEAAKAAEPKLGPL